MRALPFVLALVLSVLVLFTPASGVPTAPPGTDKVVHLLLFAALAVTGRVAGLPARPLLAGLVLYAVFSEVLQALLPLGRSGDLADVAADVLGAGLGLAVAAGAGALRRRRSRPADRPARPADQPVDPPSPLA
ncbi:VanZ family protein [Pseudonocardia nematodicida]|uniref:VanZ family protein n=1 Tax=Pseudonocardia nematodicida TaxID=1206997 RepID=A0ABV1KFG4_9PSEU